MGFHEEALLASRPTTKLEKVLFFLGTWNVRSLYRAGSLTVAARELARYKLDLVGVREFRWEKGDTGDYIFSMKTEMKIIS